MIDYENMRRIIVKGLKNYLKCPVIRNNQDEAPPDYPFVSYTVTTLMRANNGTYGEYSDDVYRKPTVRTWSITAQSSNNSESVNLISKAREWFDRAGTLYLNDNNIIVQSVGSITNRDNVLTVGYEYKNGFDVDFWLFETVGDTDTEIIETADISTNQI